MIFLENVLCSLFPQFLSSKNNILWKHISIFSGASFFLFTSSPFLKWQIFIRQIKWVGKNKNSFFSESFMAKNTLLAFPVDDAVAVFIMCWRIPGSLLKPPPGFYCLTKLLDFNPHLVGSREQPCKPGCCTTITNAGREKLTLVPNLYQSHWDSSRTVPCS